MKMQTRIFKQLVGEPVTSHQIEGTMVEIYYMNDTPFFEEFTKRGRFVTWATDGKSFKILIEKGYYEALMPLYSRDANVIWINYLKSYDNMRKKVSLVILGISLIVIAIAAILAFGFPKVIDSTYVFIAAIILIFASSMVQNYLLRKQGGLITSKMQSDMLNLFGEHEFDEIAQAQRDYANKFYSIPDENTEDVEDDAEVLEIDSDEQDEKVAEGSEVENEDASDVEEIE